MTRNTLVLPFSTTPNANFVISNESHNATMLSPGSKLPAHHCKFRDVEWMGSAYVRGDRGNSLLPTFFDSFTAFA